MSVAKSVRLGSLDHDPVIMAMPGQEARLRELEDLLASIPVEGLLQSLKVRLDDEGTRYLVTAGNRRLATLRQLARDGGAIRGEAVTDDTQVAVILSSEDDDSARAQAVAENLQRVALTPVAEVRQYAALAAQCSPKEIAARFGVPEKRVAQRLKLAALHDDVLEALDSGRITIAAAEAFTVESDPERQAKYLKKAKDWELHPTAIRSSLTRELVPATSAKALLVGEAAYREAGGIVVDDEFGDGQWWASNDVLDDLVAAHWEKKKAEWLAEGWSFVMSAAEFGDGDIWIARHAPALEPEDGEVFTAEQVAKSGVVYWENGSFDARAGVLPKGTKAEPRHAPAEPDLAQPGGSINYNLRAAVATDMGRRMTEQPGLALQVLVATLHATAVCGSGGYYMPVGIHGEEGDAPSWVDDDGEPIEGAEIPPQGRNFAEALTWAREQPVETLLAYLSERVAAELDLSPPGWHGNDEPRLALIDMFPVAFDPTSFFSQVSKPYLALAWRDMTGEKPPRAKGGDLLSMVVTTAAATGWLPPILRTPSYAGPAFTSAADGDADDADELPAVAAE